MVLWTKPQVYIQVAYMKLPSKDTIIFFLAVWFLISLLTLSSGLFNTKDKVLWWKWIEPALNSANPTILGVNSNSEVDVLDLKLSRDYSKYPYILLVINHKDKNVPDRINSLIDYLKSLQKQTGGS